MHDRVAGARAKLRTIYAMLTKQEAFRPIVPGDGRTASGT